MERIQISKRIKSLAVNLNARKYKDIRGRKIAAERLKNDFSLEVLSKYHVLFVRNSHANKLSGILKKIKGLPILTVSENHRRKDPGTMINFVVKEGKLRFAINNQAANSVGISIRSSLLRIALTWAPAPLNIAMRTGAKTAIRGLSRLNCAMQGFNQSYNIIEVPWKRAQSGTKSGDYDAFIMGTQNEQRDTYAVFSKVSLSLKWLFIILKSREYTPDDSIFSSYLFGSLAGSSMERWGIQKFPNLVSLGNIKQVIKMLNLGRVDVALLNHVHMEKLQEEVNIDPLDYKTFLIKELPTGVYFGKKFLQDKPDFLKHFNASMEKCERAIMATDTVSVSE